MYERVRGRKTGKEREREEKLEEREREREREKREGICRVCNSRNTAGDTAESTHVR